MLKRIGGQLYWVHSGLLTVDATEPHVHGWIRECLAPRENFFDVGAHYGWMSLTAAHRVGRTGHVVAFEPSPPLIEILQYHRRVNRLKQMEIVASAVSDIDCESVPFFLVNHGLSVSNSLVSHDVVGPRTECRVCTITLDSYCSFHNRWPHVVKIDVEGAELLVLKGAAVLLATKKPKLILAVHPPWLPAEQTVDDLFDLLAAYGYHVKSSKTYPFNGQEFSDYLFV